MEESGPLEETRMPMAEEVMFTDDATAVLMERWGIVFDGYSITPTKDKVSTEALVAPSQKKKVLFSHDGEDIIIVTCYEKNGDVSVIRVVEGTVQE